MMYIEPIAPPALLNIHSQLSYTLCLFSVGLSLGLACSCCRMSSKMSWVSLPYRETAFWLISCRWAGSKM